VGTHWVEPFLVVEVDSHATAKNQRLRQPSYRGVRADLSPEDLL
jgi:bifunctional non-homologous end joining protein LigD